LLLTGALALVLYLSTPSDCYITGGGMAPGYCRDLNAGFVIGLGSAITLLIWAPVALLVWLGRRGLRDEPNPHSPVGAPRPDNVRALCSNCGRPQSPYWNYKCNHCGGSYERYPPKVEPLK
jgi:hypothetical protein